MLKTEGKIKSHSFRETEAVKQAAAIIITVLMSILATRSVILGYLSPVNVVVTAVSGSCGVFAFLAAAIVYIAGGNLTEGLFQLSSMAFIFLCELIIEHLKIKRRSILVSKAFITAACMAVAAMITAVFAGLDGGLFGYRLMFSLLCGCLVYFVSDASNRAGTDGMLDLNGTNGASIGIVYVVLTATLSSTEILKVNVGIVFSTIVMLFMARKYKHIGGAVCGALTTCAVLVCSPELARNTLLLSVSGLLCGTVSVCGTVVTALCFVLSGAVGLMAAGFGDDAFAMLINYAVGAVIFSALPEGVVSNLFRYMNGSSRSVYIVGQTASSRLKFTSGTLKDIRRRLLSISDTLEKKKSVVPLYHRLRCSCCSECRQNSTCWKDNKEETFAAFMKLEKLMNRQGRATTEDIIDILPFCIARSSLMRELESQYFSFISERTENRKVNELREMLLEQLLAMEDLLSDLSYRVEKITEVDSPLSERVRKYLLKQGFGGVKVCVYCDENKMKRVEIFSAASLEGDYVKITVDIGVIIDCELDMPVLSCAEGMNRLTFSPRTDCVLKSGVSQLIGRSESLCGDTVERIWLSSTEYAVILSDGMGTGRRAKLDSSFAVTLVSRFLASGIMPETSFRLINSILRVKGWDESFATADVVIIDLCRKTARFIKAGAAPSYISRKGELVKIEESSFPLGILGETTPACREIKLLDGDRIIVTSDGVGEKAIVSCSREFVKNDLNSSQAAELVAALAEKCSNGCGENVKNDDISVCVIDVFVNE